MDWRASSPALQLNLAVAENPERKSQSSPSMEKISTVTAHSQMVFHWFCPQD